MTTEDLEVELSRLRFVEREHLATIHALRVENGQLRTDLNLSVLNNQKWIDDVRGLQERIARILTQVRGT